jgi:hypothetical protein
MGTSAAETLVNAEAPLEEEAICNSPHVTQALQEVYEAARRGKFLEETNSDDSPLSILASTVEPPPDQSTISLLDGIRTISKCSQLWISVGGLHIRGASPHPETGRPRWYNTHLVLDDQGTIRAVYRKIHLFDVCIPGKVELRESASTAAGHEVVVCDTPVGTYDSYSAKLQAASSGSIAHFQRMDAATNCFLSFVALTHPSSNRSLGIDYLLRHALSRTLPRIGARKGGPDPPHAVGLYCTNGIGPLACVVTRYVVWELSYLFGQLRASFMLVLNSCVYL